MHSIHLTVSSTSRLGPLTTALRSIVEEELIFETDTLPNPRDLGHAKQVFSHTVCRMADHVRGRIDGTGTSRHPARSEATVSVCRSTLSHCQHPHTVTYLRSTLASEAKLRATQAKLLQAVSGDIRLPRFVHHEKACGRCGERSDAVDLVVSAILESGFVDGGGLPPPASHRRAPAFRDHDTQIPPLAKRRWGTCASSLSLQVGGVMLCNVLPRLVARLVDDTSGPSARTHSTTADGVGAGAGAEGPEDGDPNAYRRWLRNKALRAANVLQDENWVAQAWHRIRVLVTAR